VKARLPEKLPLMGRPQQILPATRDRREIDVAVLNEEHKVGVLTLVEDCLILFVIGGGSAGADQYKQAMSIHLIG
jgi:hypothetical protein